MQSGELAMHNTAHTAIPQASLICQQAVGHLAKCSNHGRGRKAEKPGKQSPFQTLLKQPVEQSLVLGYN